MLAVFAPAMEPVVRRNQRHARGIELHGPGIEKDRVAFGVVNSLYGSKD